VKFPSATTPRSKSRSMGKRQEKQTQNLTCS